MCRRATTRQRSRSERDVRASRQERGERAREETGGTVAEGDLPEGEVHGTNTIMSGSPASTTQDEIVLDKQHMMGLPRQGRERSVVVAEPGAARRGVVRRGSSQGERRPHHAAQHQSHHRPPSRLRQQHHPGHALLLKGEAGSWRSLRHSVVKHDQNCSHTSLTKIS